MANELLVSHRQSCYKVVYDVLGIGWLPHKLGRPPPLKVWKICCPTGRIWFRKAGGHTACIIPRYLRGLPFNLLSPCYCVSGERRAMGSPGEPDRKSECKPKLKVLHAHSLLESKNFYGYIASASPCGRPTTTGSILFACLRCAYPTPADDVFKSSRRVHLTGCITVVQKTMQDFTV